LKIIEGAAIRQTALKHRKILCASGSDSQVVPICFQINATALWTKDVHQQMKQKMMGAGTRGNHSIRKILTPALARNSISLAIALKTAGFE
jgi:hypothetical protein